MKKLFLFALLLSGCYERYWNRAQADCMKLCHVERPQHGYLLACNKNNCECACIPPTEYK